MFVLRHICPYFFIISSIPSFQAARQTDEAPRENTPESSQAVLFFSSRTTAPSNAVTYLERQFLDSTSEGWKRLSWSPGSGSKPDTTVVLLNWSRLQNVILQVSVYCDPGLQDIIEQVFVWNNQPKIKLSYDQHFSSTGCSAEKLQIFNSPSNVYFQARFMGCVHSYSHYCFLQDDDYLTRPEVFRTIHASFSGSELKSSSPPPIILLPSHDHLETDLLRVSMPYISGSINTTFACLGHGIFLLRSQASAYLTLLRRLELSEEEMNIADNYFTLLNARPPKTWFTHTIELSDNEVLPFTVGVQGNERNWRHIERAMFYLNKILEETPSAHPLPHFSPSIPASSWTHTAPCIQDACTVSSNILMTPSLISSEHGRAGGGVRMRDIQATRLAQFGQEGARWYIDHPLSKAVDGDVATAFRSTGYAKEGDVISLALLHPGFIHDGPGMKIYLEVVWLVDAETASILHETDLEISQDGILWRSSKKSDLTCLPAISLLPRDPHIHPPFILGLLYAGLGNQGQSSNEPSTSFERTLPGRNLFECHTSLETERYFPKHMRVRLRKDKQAGWAVYEVWLRSRTTT